MNYENIVAELSNLSLSQLKDLMGAIKEQAKETKEREQNELASIAQGLGIAVTDTVIVRMAGGETAEGVVSKITDKGVTVKIDGRDRALFRAWHLVDNILFKGEGLPEAPVTGNYAFGDVAEGDTVTFALKGAVHTGVVKRVGEKSFTVHYTDPALNKERNLARPYSSIVSVGSVADEDLDADGMDEDLAI